MSLGNPYVVDRPLAGGDAFVARYKLLAEAAQSVRRGRQLLLVYGTDRVGKTSFMQQLRQELSAEFLVLYVDFTWPDGADASSGTYRDIAQQAVQELQARIAEELAEALGQPQVAPTDTDATVPSLAAMLGRQCDQPAVILIEGLSLQHLRAESGREFVARWQQWMASAPSARFVITINGSLEGATAFAPALASLPSVELQYFSLEETEDLLLRAAEGRILYDFAAIRHIMQLTSGQPYLVQLFAYWLFNRHSGGARVRVPDVDAVIPAVLTAAGSFLEGIWSALPPLAQAVLVLSNELKGRHGVLTVDDLLSTARVQAVGLSELVIEAALKEWQAQGVLHKLSADTYSFAVPLFQRWLVEHKPTARTLVELKFRRSLAVPRTTAPTGRYFRWSNIALELAAVVLVGAIVVLWNMRGSAQRTSIGPVPTETPAPFATRATLVIGPSLGRIAYMAKDDPDATWDIWVMRGDGSDPQQLTDDPADDFSPAWSADGKSIAFVAERDGNREIYVMKADGTQQINLTHHAAEDWSPAWSPDGTRIAFSSYRDGNWEIYVMGADGSNPTRLTSDSAADYGPCWSPDSQWIAFHSNRDGNWEIYVIRDDGEGLRRLTQDEATDFAPAWSPDGQQIAFESYRDGNMEIYLVAADGGDQWNITDEPYSNEHGPAWARGGTKLLYFSNRDGGWDIFSMNPDGTEKSNQTLSTALEQGPEWHE